MKLWTVTTEGRSGTETNVFLTESAAEASAQAWCKLHWWEEDGPMPEDWREAWDKIEDNADGDWMWFEEHDLTPPPLSEPDRDLSVEDAGSYLLTVWAALHDLEALRGTDEGLDDVKTAMAWIAEGLGVEDPDEPEDAAQRHQREQDELTAAESEFVTADDAPDDEGEYETPPMFRAWDRTGGAAFPRGPIGFDCDKAYGQQEGLTKREWYAGQAMAAMLGGYWSNPEMSGLRPDSFARDAFEMADAMIEAGRA